MQLNRMAPAWEGCEVTYVTTDPGFRDQVVPTTVGIERPQVRFYAITDANRWQKFRLLLSLVQITLILLRRRPDVVISTGAAPGFFALRLARLMGSRTVWVDSIANAEELSLSGKMIGPYCSLWLTQWEHLAKPEGPHYKGSVI